MSSWTSEQVELQARAASFQKHIKLHIKEGWFWNLCGWLLFIITFGQLKRETFANTAVCIANHHFYPRSWTYGLVLRTLPHEAKHTAQCLMLGLYTHPLVGFPLFLILYFLLPVPILFAYFRFRAELDANIASWQHNEITGLQLDAEIVRFIFKISGSSYFWSVPKSFAEKQTLKAVLETNL